jgi:PKD repeat protein
MRQLIRLLGVGLLALMLFGIGSTNLTYFVSAQIPPTPLPYNPWPSNPADTIRIAITSPQYGATVSGDVTILGSALHPLFSQYQILYAPDPNPQGVWYSTGILSQFPVNDGVLGVWNTTFIANGTYQLRLTVNLQANTALTTQISGVRVQNQSFPVPTPIPTDIRPVAAFVPSIVIGSAPLTVQFNNQSYGNIASYQWDFGDGTTSTDPNPSHIYNAAGLYPVTLTVTGSNGQDARQLFIQVLPPPVATATPIPPAATPVVQEAVIQVSDSADDVNQRDNEYDEKGTSVWIGNGGSTKGVNIAGLRFKNVPIPQGATILSARIEFYNPVFQWIELGINISADATGNSASFSRDNPPSQRTPGTQAVQLESNDRSNEKSWIAYGDIASVIQEVVNRGDWQMGNSLSIIIQGRSAGKWGRKFFTSFDGDPAFAPRLIIRFQTP